MPPVCSPSARPSRRNVTTRSSAALMALLVLCLCEVGSVLVAEESAAVQGAVKPQSANAQHQTWQQHQEKERPRTVRRSQPGWIQPEESDDQSYAGKGSSSPLPSSSAAWIEPLVRQQWEPMVAEQESAGSNDARSEAKGGSWRDNELAPAGDQVDGRSDVQQLNWHEAQLARLHGLGPAEIAALSTWQHKLRLHPLPNRLIATTGWHHHQPPSFSPRNLLPLNGGSPKSSLRSQQVLTPFDDANVPAGKLGGSHPRLQYVQQSNQTQDEGNENLLLLPLWPKRSDMKKSDRENNRNRNAANRKEKAEAGNAGPAASKGNKAKGSRKQQQHSQESSQHRPFSGATSAATSAMDAAAMQQHEHNGRPSGGSSPTPDVNRMNRNLATQFLLRSPRENRQYDVPIIGKPTPQKPPMRPVH